MATAHPNRPATIPPTTKFPFDSWIKYGATRAATIPEIIHTANRNIEAPCHG